MKIGFDIDGVIVDYTASIQQLLSDKYGITFQQLGVPYINPWNVEAYFPKLPQTILKDLHSYVCCNLDFVRNCVLRQSVLHIINTLHNEGHKLSIVTNRPEMLLRETMHRLGPFASCFESQAFYQQEERDYHKVKRCKKLQLDVLIDDQIDNLTKVAHNSDTKAILFNDEPWLHDVSVDRNHILVANSKTLMPLLQQLKRR